MKGGKLGDVASASIVDSSVGEIFVDQTDATFRGGWATYDSPDASDGSFARSSATKPTQTANTATFTSSDLATGNYFVYVRYPASAKAATNATFNVLSGTKVQKVAVVDQTVRGGGWVLLGKFVSDLTKGQLAVQLTSLNANGSVSADAVRFLPADEATVDAYVAAKKKKTASGNVEVVT